MKKCFLILSLISAALVLSAAGESAPRIRTITVAKTTSQNPSIWFGGVPGDEALTNALNRFLNACGWFDCVKDAKAADYTLEGKNEGRLYQNKNKTAFRKGNQ